MRKLKSILSLVLCFVLTLQVANFTMVYAATDYENHWAKSQIEKLINEDIVTGYEDGSIKPDNNISRAEFVTIINNLFGYSEKANSNFADVNSDMWYANQFLIAKKAGYLSGDDHGYANPEKFITRAEVCVIAAKVLNLEKTEYTNFTDNSMIPAWAKGYIGAMSKASLINGYPDGSFGASNNITRAEAFVIISNILDKENNAEITTVNLSGSKTNDDNSETTTSEATETTTARKISSGGGGGGSNKPSAVYYTVTFDASGAGDVTNLPVVQTIKSGDCAVEPSTPTRPSYIFDGWYSDAALTARFDFSTPVTSNITLYAKWQNTSTDIDPDADFSVSFVLNNGTEGVYELQSVRAKETATKPVDPARENYRFTGWYTESETANEFDFSTPIESDITLYAGWGNPDGTEGLYTADYDPETIYSVSGIEMGDRCVNVTINTNSTSILVVNFIDENTDEILNTIAMQTPSYCEIETLSIPVEFSLPQHYKISAVLVDGNNTELCEPYVCIKYTSKFEEFDAKTVDDFDSDRVINFDEDINDNFSVLAEDVKTIKAGTSTNVLTVNEIEVEGDVVPDFEYVFANPDSTVTSLEIGDKVFINESNHLFKIGNIQTDSDGNIVITPSKDVVLTEFYEFLKADMSYEDNTTADNDEGIQTYAKLLDQDGTLEGSFNGSLSWNPGNRNWLQVEGSFSGKVGVDIETYYDARLWEADEFYFSLVTTKSITINVEAKATKDNSDTVKDGLDLAKVHFPTPVPGLYVYTAVTFPTEWKFSGKVGATYTSKTKSGFAYSSLTGKNPIESKENKFTITALEGSAEIKFGPKFDVGIKIIGDMVKANLGAQVGAKASVTATVYQPELTTGDSKHSCGLCAKGSVKLFFDISAAASAKITNVFKWSISIPIINGETTYKFGNNKASFYWSIINSSDSMFGGHPKFGAGTCPNNAYRTKIIVKDDQGNEIADCTVNIHKTNSDFASSGKSPFTDFLYKGVYNVSANINGTEVSKKFTVDKEAQEIVLTPSSADGRLKGEVVDSTNNNPISNADIVISDGDVIIKTLKSGADGSFSVSLPDKSLNVCILKDGYIPFSSYETIHGEETNYMETVKLVPGDGRMGGFSGTITDAVTGRPVEDVQIQVRKGWNNSSEGRVLKSVTTDSNGKYNCSALTLFDIVIGFESGNYTVTASKEGYVTSSFNVTVLPGVVNNENQNATISPEGTGEGQYRIVLRWGENPSDLDSHVVGKLSDESKFHVYFNHKSEYDGDVEVCNLDVDDRDGEGPETITLNANSSEPYYYYIYHYAGSGTVATSGAQIRVYKENQLLRTFNVPTGQGDGRYWNVFAIVNGQLVVSNTITDDSDLSYANSNSTNILSALSDAIMPEYDTSDEDNMPKEDENVDDEVDSDVTLENTENSDTVKISDESELTNETEISEDEESVVNDDASVTTGQDTDLNEANLEGNTASEDINAANDNAVLDDTDIADIVEGIVQVIIPVE